MTARKVRFSLLHRYTVHTVGRGYGCALHTGLQMTLRGGRRWEHMAPKRLMHGRNSNTCQQRCRHPANARRGFCHGRAEAAAHERRRRPLLPQHCRLRLTYLRAQLRWEREASLGSPARTPLRLQPEAPRQQLQPLPAQPLPETLLLLAPPPQAELRQIRQPEIMASSMHWVLAQAAQRHLAAEAARRHVAA